MTRKKSLKKRLLDENSSTWRNKADKLWKHVVAHWGDHKCAICGISDFVQAHHLIPREMYSHRHDPKNGILLCCSHHKYSFEISPHKAPVAFFKWMIEHKPDLWKWLPEQEPSKEHAISYKDAAANLEVILQDIDVEYFKKTVASALAKSSTLSPSQPSSSSPLGQSLDPAPLPSPC